MLDSRTGLITREWYMFFLSLFTATHAVDAADVTPGTASLVATYDAALQAFAQATDVKPLLQDAGLEAQKHADAEASAPPPQIAELQAQIDALRQELQTLRQPDLAAFVAANSTVITLTAAAQRVTGDMSSATAATRMAFQSSTPNGNTTFTVLPNGTAVASQILTANNSDPTNCSFGSVFVSATEVRLQSSRLGTGSFLPLTLYAGGAERMQADINGNVRVGTAALATTATNGFLYIPTCPGTPTGVPTAVTGLAPMVVDSTNNKLYFYSGGAWRDAGP